MDLESGTMEVEACASSARDETESHRNMSQRIVEYASKPAASDRPHIAVVTGSKALVYFALFFVVVEFGTISFAILNNHDYKNYEEEFFSVAHRIVDTANKRGRFISESLQNFNIEIMSYAETSSSAWPFVTMPHFYKDSIHRGGAEIVAMAPIVEESVAEKFSTYTRDILQAAQTQSDSNQEFQSFNFSGQPYDIPVWQISPLTNYSGLLFRDLSKIDTFKECTSGMYRYSRKGRKVCIPGIAEDAIEYISAGSNQDTQDEQLSEAVPHNIMFSPIFSSFNEGEKGVVGHSFAATPWTSYFAGILPSGRRGLVVVVRDRCTDSALSLVLNGIDSHFLGRGDLHDTGYDDIITLSADFQPYRHLSEASDSSCPYTLSLYSSQELASSYKSNKPTLYSTYLSLVFFLSTMVFAVYDCAVERRHKSVSSSLEKTSAVVSSLFPQSFQDRIMKTEEMETADRSKHPDGSLLATKPIADLFPHCTVLFADLVGFTNWSSTRQPIDVFTLLETIFNAFDEAARRRGVYKVETIGDCYVAVTGLPEPCKEHAVVMARFAFDCRRILEKKTRILSETLGADTENMSLRIGLHSGPVTAGVLRGEKCRFQLFGDTVNTASRIESNGQPQKIHLSEETAFQLKHFGKSHWIKERVDKVIAKGKGELRTFWLERPGSSLHEPALSTSGSQAMPSSELEKMGSGKQARLIDWHVDLLGNLLKGIIAKRNARKESERCLDEPFLTGDNYGMTSSVGSLSIAEMQITIPFVDSPPQSLDHDISKVELDEKVAEQLCRFVQCVAAMHNSNPFHNFHHVSHVTMFATRMLAHLTCSLREGDKNFLVGCAILDPLIQFGAILGGLVHAVGHPGVSNVQLVIEEAPLAKVYRYVSIVEQNAFDLAWRLFMDDSFADLRNTIYTSNAEFEYFRQVVVSSVLATDFEDRKLNAARAKRWDAVFTNSSTDEDNPCVWKERATLLLEHLLQASVLVHTMQEWQLHCEWSGRKFSEVYASGLQGDDPALTWHEMELDLLQNVVLPLTTKLSACGLFSTPILESIRNVEKNIEKWVKEGLEMVRKIQMDAAKEALELLSNSQIQV